MLLNRLHPVEKGVALVVIDNSGEMVNYYKAHSPPGTPVRSISMEYADGVGLNLGRALMDPINRRLFAKLMSEDINASNSRMKGGNPFFTKMSEIVTSNAIKCLTTTAGEDFFLADIVRLVTFPALHEYFCKVAKVKNPYDNFGESDSRRDTAVTLVSHFEPLASFAAVDMRAETRIDLPINDGVFASVQDWWTPAISSLHS